MCMPHHCHEKCARDATEQFSNRLEQHSVTSLVYVTVRLNHFCTLCREQVSQGLENWWMLASLYRVRALVRSFPIGRCMMDGT